MKNVGLGIPLAVGMAGTVASLFVGGKKLHTAFGIAWTALSLVHAYHFEISESSFIYTGTYPCLQQSINQ